MEKLSQIIKGKLGAKGVVILAVGAILLLAGGLFAYRSSSNKASDIPAVAAADDSEDQAEQETPDKDAAETAQKMSDLKDDIEDLVEAYGSSVAVAVERTDGSGGFSINGDERFVSASMIKLLVLSEFLEQVDAGKLALDTSYTLNGSEVVGGTGIIQGSSKSTYTYDELAYDMIAYSDNTATNILIDTLGMDSINEYAKTHKLDETLLQRHMMDLNSGVENYISARNAVAILRSIANHEIASEALSKRAEEYLLAQSDTEGLREGIPGEVSFGHKTGTLVGIRHDGGIVYCDDPYVIVVLTSLNEGEANSLMRSVAQAVYAKLDED